MHVTFCPPNTEFLSSVISCNYHCHSRYFSILNALTTLCQASYHEQRVPLKMPLWWAFPFVAPPEHGQALPWWWLLSSLSVKGPENSAYYFQITSSTGNSVDSFRQWWFHCTPQAITSWCGNWELQWHIIRASNFWKPGDSKQSDFIWLIGMWSIMGRGPWNAKMHSSCLLSKRTKRQGRDINYVPCFHLGSIIKSIVSHTNRLQWIII